MGVVWGPNSQGKTSLAEAIEFLITGRIVRREFVASAVREFSDSLRNVHLPEDVQVLVRARIEDASGSVHDVERRLLRDYTGRDSCTSELVVDGAVAVDLAALGIRLSQPPLAAPILMQHTLRYVVSAEPQRRADYFKALLEVSGLEAIRTSVSEAMRVLDLPSSPVREALERCLVHGEIGPAVRALETADPSAERVAETLRNALAVVLSDMEPLPEALDERLALAKRTLQERREGTFPFRGFDTGAAPTWREPDGSVWAALEAFARLRSSVDREAARLTRLFEEVLKIPCVADATAAVDCPVCETPEALTPERISAIRTQLSATQAFRNADRAARSALQGLAELATQIDQAVLEGTPVFLGWDEGERKGRGFTEERIASLFSDRAEDPLRRWRECIEPLQASLAGVTNTANDLREAVRGVDPTALDATAVELLRAKVAALMQAADDFVQRRTVYVRQADPLVRALRGEVDRRGGTEGWPELIDLVDQGEPLLGWLVERHARDKISRKMAEALQEIDRAKAGVLDEKFAQLGDDIGYWWNLLRPDEPTSFGGIHRVGTGRRFIDLKAKLSATDENPARVALRDAVAVFSDSQLNCLGLCAFLARTVRGRAGFVVLDDPVPASDGEHRAMFVSRVLKELLDRSFQVILMTHDERTWRDVQESYGHLDLDTFLVCFDDPLARATIENRSDRLDALLARAAPYTKNANPDIRKIGAGRLRDAAERFCKLMIVQDRRDGGDATAAVSEYDGKTLGDLVPRVQPLLTKDASHPGKLRAIGQRLNPGAHDHSVPPPGDLRVCLGDLKVFRKEYL